MTDASATPATSATSATPATSAAPGASSGGHAADRAHNSAVAGLQWGDEGKGKIVDLMAESFDVVVRYNGGANAGHTVVVDDARFALHLVPCGVLRPGATGVIGNGVVVDPEVLLAEMADLREAGIELGDNLRISDRAHVVLPYHKLEDGLREAVMSSSLGQGKEVGTTGRGIGPTYADKAHRSTAVRVGDLLEPPRLRAKLELIARIKNATLGALAELVGRPFEPLDPAALSGLCAEYGEALGPHVCNTGELLHALMRDGRTLLFEGANGFLLDVDHGTYPYVTSSNSSALGLYPGAGVPGSAVGEVIGVVKAYTSRVGGGPFPTEQDNEIGQRMRDRGHEYGTTTGRPRRCGWLDLVAVPYAARTCGATALAVTLLDVLAGFEVLRVCNAYVVDGERTDVFPASAYEVATAEAAYETMPGFDQEVTDCRTYDDLPSGARRYLAKIEEYVGVPVRIVSVGPERTQTIVIDR